MVCGGNVVKFETKTAFGWQMAKITKNLWVQDSNDTGHPERSSYLTCIFFYYIGQNGARLVDLIGPVEPSFTFMFGRTSLITMALPIVFAQIYLIGGY